MSTTRQVQSQRLGPGLLSVYSKIFLEHQLLFSGGKTRKLDYCVAKERDVLRTRGTAIKVSQVTWPIQLLGLLWGISRAAWEIMSHSIYNRY